MLGGTYNVFFPLSLLRVWREVGVEVGGKNGGAGGNIMRIGSGGKH